MSKKVCAICGCSLTMQNERICSRCENILLTKHDEVFEVMYAKSKCSLPCVKVGDYVNYIPDNHEANEELKDKEIKWRVWAINGDEVLIMPTEPVGRVVLGKYHDWDKTFEDYKNAVEKIEAECAKYGSHKAIGVRSLKIEDLEDLNVSTLASQKVLYSNGYKYDEITTPYTSGLFGVQYDEKTEKNKMLNSCIRATRKNPVKLQQTYYCSEKPGWKRLSTSNETYGTLLGERFSWLASPCVFCLASIVNFDVYFVNGDYVDADFLLSSYGDTRSVIDGVRPLVSLSSKLLKLDKTSDTFAIWDID